MHKVMKKQGKTVKAYRLGEEHEVLRSLMEEKKLVPIRGGEAYEVLSQEALAGGGHGEIAARGDYIKLDSSGYPYPNTAEFFEKNHAHVEGDTYMQRPVPLSAWTMDEPMCGEIRYLVDHRGLVLSERGFCAPLWGTMQSAPADAVLVLYRVERDEAGRITDVDYGFVVREEFEKTYARCPD